MGSKIYPLTPSVEIEQLGAPGGRFVLAGLLFLFSLFSTAYGAPQSEGRGQDAAFQAAQSAALEGRSLIRERRFQEAIQAYQRAQSLFPEPKNLFLIASLYQKLPGQCARELEHWSRFMEACPRCQYRSRGEERNQEVRQRCIVRLSVASVPPGATLLVNGETRGQTPYQGDFVVGTYQLQLLYDGYQREQIPLQLQAESGSREVSRELKLLQSVTPPGTDDHRILAWSLIGLGVGGSLLGLQQLSVAEEEVERARTAADQASYDGARRSFDTAQLYMWSGFALGLGGGLAGLWLLIDAPGTEHTQFVAGPNGLTVTGQF